MSLLVAIVTTTSLFNLAAVIWIVALLHKILKELTGVPSYRWNAVEDPR